MHDRVYGLETEYAVLFQPLSETAAHPCPRYVYQRLEAFVRQRCKTLPASHKSGVFLENGGLLHFEGDLEDGVIEVSTPECRSAREAVLYQQAMDSMLCSLLPELNERLRREGFEGTVVLGRNSTDNKGHFYGSQENYYVAGCSRGRTWLAPLLVLLTAVFSPLHTLFRALPMLPLMAMLAVSRAIGFCLRMVGSRRASTWPEQSQHTIERVTLKFSRSLLHLLSPLVSLYVRLVSSTVFAPCIEELTAFLVTRPIWCGSGRLKMPPTPGHSPFHLMQKSDAMGSVTGVSAPGAHRPIFDFKHLLSHPLTVLRQRQRLQVGYSDSNMSEQVGWLKLAITGLLLEMIEDGVRVGVRLTRPMHALHEVSHDATLSRPLLVAGGPALTALQIQQRYLQVARQYFEVHPGDGTPAQILDAWEAMLVDLAESGKIRPMWNVDWSAKRTLMVEALRGMTSIEDLALIRTWSDEMDRAQVSLDALAKVGERDVDERLRTALSARSYVTLNHYLHARSLSWHDFLTLLRLSWQVEKIDLKYHQSGSSGYAQQLMDGGLMPRMSTDDEIKQAQITPPGRTRARIRGWLVRRFEKQGARLDWEQFHGKRGERLALGDPLDSNPAALSSQGLPTL